MRKRPLLWFACTFLMGLAYQRYESYGLIGLVIVLIGLEIFYGIKSKKYKRMAGRSMVLLSAFLLGMVHMQKEEAFREAYLNKVEENSQTTIWGEIMKTEHTDYGVRVILSDCYIRLEGEQIPCNDVMVYASSDHFQVGEIHKIIGEFHRFKQARNEGNFDARIFYESQKIDFYIEEKESLLLGEAGGFWQNVLLSVKIRLQKVYDDCLEEKSAGFYKNLLLGDRTDLDERIKELFTLAGISHILAISGLHVSMIGRGFYKQIRKRGIGFGVSGILSANLLLSYGSMVGNGVSTQRAIGMMIIFFLAQYIGRSYDMLNALGGICVILLWQNPFLIEYFGFWFSVTALLGIGFVGNCFSAEVEKGKGFLMSLGISLTTLPVVAVCYYEMPLYSTAVNFLLLPLLTPMFCMALLGGVIGVFLPAVAKILLLPCAWGLGLYEWICTFVAELPFSSVITGKPSTIQIIVYYVVLCAGVLGLRFWQRKQKILREKEKKKDDRGIVGILALSVLCFILIAFPKEKTFEITFLDVGQGDGIYISTGDGTTCFIDGGSTSVSALGEYRILPFLKAKGIGKIDYWFVSHADTDHTSGLLEVLESGYNIEYLVMADACPKDENYEVLLSAANSNDIQVIFMKEGDQIVSENAVFTCLYPGETEVADRNEASLVLQMETTENADMGNFSVLFAGDISAEVEAGLLREGVLEDITLLKGIHHGSNYSNSEALLQQVHPEIIVVSCGENNLYGHPGEMTVERYADCGAEVFYTMELGQVTIRFEEKKGLVIDGYLLLQ